MPEERDRWAEWLLSRRFGGETQTPVWAERLARIRDRVLDGADLEAGQTVLDVGAGDGLIAFGALERGAGEVVLADVSRDLLEHARGLAGELGWADRARFVEAGAETLAPILRPLVERGEGVGRRATAYLRATKPA